MLLRLVIPLFLGLAVWPGQGGADDDRRRLFIEALGKVETGAAEAEDFASLSDYVLFPYLQAAELSRALRRSPGEYTEQRVRTFIDTYGDTALTRWLRRAWLRRLASQEKWQTYLDYYPGRIGEEFECLATQARISLGQDDALPSAQSLWLTGSSRDKACDPVFAWLQSSGHLSQALIEQRVRLAMENGNTSLVRYLSGKQTGTAQARSQHWLRVWQNPRDAIRTLARSGDSSMDAEMLAQVFRKLAQRERDTAAELYEAAMEKSQAEETLRQQLAAYIGFRYILNREPEALQWYRRSGNVPLRDIENEWRIRSAIYAESWSDVLHWIDGLVETQQQTPRWQYWRGRALLATGKTAAGKKVLAGIDGQRDFHAFLAADLTGREYAIQDRPVAVNAAQQKQLSSLPQARRALELWHAGLNDKARAEWNDLLGRLTPEEQLQAGVLADEQGWWSRAIVSYGRGGYWDDLGRRFPAPYRNLVSAEAQRQGIDRAWVYAIMRSESLFVEDARSPVGALGLMQLMPRTGQNTARREGMRWIGTAMLFQPAHNIRLGTRYLADMLERFDGHLAMATAAYNAGPRNVDKWRPARELPADIWIETIPFAATHDYLRHVLEFTATYEWRLTGKAARLSQRLAPVAAR